MPGFEGLFAALREAGMQDVPESFSICTQPQTIPRVVSTEIEAFIRVFDRVTTRPAWQASVTAAGPAIVKQKRSEVCFFSAWDFHLPPGRPEAFQLIELNDNGSGLVFAAIVNRVFYEVSGLGAQPHISAPVPLPSFEAHVTEIIRREADAFFGSAPPSLLMILDDAESLEKGRFRHELELVRDLCRRAGWPATIGAPADTTWDGTHLSCGGERVSFVVNRSTDFLFEAEALAPVRAAYADGSVLIAPNPFTYATRSDKRLLELLSVPVADAELGIAAEERDVLDAHVPETRLLRSENVEGLAHDKADWFWKPCHGFASHGVLTGAQVGRERLRRLLKKGIPYVAQRRAPKTRLESSDGVPLWTDLRVWAYRGEPLMMSGRASRDPDTIDLSPPGGWMPTYTDSGTVAARPQQI